LEALEERCVPSAGDLDTTFGSGSVATASISSYNNKFQDIAIQSDGKIVTTAGFPAVTSPFRGS
jgi:hypothetical protein